MSELRRFRFLFSKRGALRYAGHLDLHRIWERAARRAKLRLKYSEGFHPQPKIQLASALPLGFSSRGEVADLWLWDAPSDALERLRAALPPGMEIFSMEEVDVHAPALQTQVFAAEYEAVLLDEESEDALRRRVDSVMAAETLPRVRRGKPYDLRPLIRRLRLLPPDESGHLRLFMELSAREGATGRADEVLDALGIPLAAARVERLWILFAQDDSAL